MTEYRVKWAQCPTSMHPSRVLFVMADDKDNARTIARNHIERTEGIGWLHVQEISEAQPMPPGVVVGDTK